MTATSLAPPERTLPSTAMAPLKMAGLDGVAVGGATRFGVMVGRGVLVGDGVGVATWASTAATLIVGVGGGSTCVEIGMLMGPPFELISIAPAREEAGVSPLTLI